MSPRRVTRGMTVMAVISVLAALLAAPVSAAPPAKGGAGLRSAKKLLVREALLLDAAAKHSLKHLLESNAALASF